MKPSRERTPRGNSPPWPPLPAIGPVNIASGPATNGASASSGETLREDFLKPPGLSASRLAIELHVPVTRISEIIHGRRSITAGTALRLARYLGTSAQFWVNLQANYDLEAARETSVPGAAGAMRASVI